MSLAQRFAALTREQPASWRRRNCFRCDWPEPQNSSSLSTELGSA